MSIGSWDPSVGQSGDANGISADWLHRCVAFSAADQLHELSQHIDPDDVQRHASLMQRELEDWATVAAGFTSDELRHLVRFYTVAEALPGWKAGHKSPVIAFARQLRERGEKLDRELLLWIREHSDNRFLPYGPL